MQSLPKEIASMKIFLGIFFVVFLGGAILSLQACTALTTLPLASVFGGAQLAVKGAELQKEIRKADVREAYDRPFEKTWNMTVGVLQDLGMETTKIKRNQEGDGGLIEARAQRTKIRIVAAKVTEEITEIGIWAGHDEALAKLIAEKIKEREQEQEVSFLGR